MQDYISLRIDADPCNETITDLLAAFLCDLGFESFTPDESGLTAFVKEEDYDEESIKGMLAEFPIESDFSLSIEKVEGQDWNEEWEKNYFQPITVGNEYVVHSSFHKDVPEAKYRIVVDPKMAFGTGHHSTTSQMMRHILESDMAGKTVIDMGTGTGILAMLSRMKGAGKVYGIEIDPFACDNARDNVKLNNVEAEMICGDASNLAGLPECDFFLANINRNIITGDLDKYSVKLKKGGVMFLSGFYEQDIPIVTEVAKNMVLSFEKYWSTKIGLR